MVLYIEVGHSTMLGTLVARPPVRGLQDKAKVLKGAPVYLLAESSLLHKLSDEECDMVRE